MNHLEALRTIAEYPASAQDDMQAANMRKIAQEALAGGVERLRSGSADDGKLWEIRGAYRTVRDALRAELAAQSAQGGV